MLNVIIGNELFIFCRNSIFKLQNINNSSTVAIVPVTKNVGCLDGKTIQEIFVGRSLKELLRWQFHLGSNLLNWKSAE